MANRCDWHKEVIGACPLDGWARTFFDMCVNMSPQNDHCCYLPPGVD